MMWPFIPLDQIDWGATAQMITAIGAVVALIWSVRSSDQQRKVEVRQNKAEHYRRLAQELENRTSDIVSFGTHIAQIGSDNLTPEQKQIYHERRIAIELFLSSRGWNVLQSKCQRFLVEAVNSSDERAQACDAFIEEAAKVIRLLLSHVVGLETEHPA